MGACISRIQRWIVAAGSRYLLAAACLLCAVPAAKSDDEVPEPLGSTTNDVMSSSVYQNSEEPNHGIAAREEKLDPTIGGWISQGFTWNPASPRDRYNGPVSFNDRANEYQLNQLYLFIDRPAYFDAGHFGLGFRADMVFGTDAFQFQSYGFDDQIVSGNFSTFYKLAFPQLYLEAALPFAPDASVKFGKWYSPLGYESGLAAEDFFYSYPLAFNITPFTHTGILLDFPLNDQITTEIGLHRGMDVWEGDSSFWGYSCGITWTSQDERTSIAFVMGSGPVSDSEDTPENAGDVGGSSAPKPRNQLLGIGGWLEYQWTERLRYAFNFDVLQMEDRRNDQPFTEAYAFTQSVFYDWSDRVTAGARFELARDDDGGFIYGFRADNPAAAGTYTNLTLGLNVRCGRRAILRPEVRWDWQNRDDSSALPAFRDGRSNHQFLFATDLVVVF
ncbi:MAG: porin [Planctomycetaceae bacterium]|nr:MAG: porin [Planctomycetaceae bacterium]